MTTMAVFVSLVFVAANPRRHLRLKRAAAEAAAVAAAAAGCALRRCARARSYFLARARELSVFFFASSSSLLPIAVRIVAFGRRLLSVSRSSPLHSRVVRSAALS